VTRSVVLVHGLGVSHRYLVPTARALAPEFQVHAPDLPGFGLSEKPSRVLQLSELADALAEHARPHAPVVLLANSFGCQIVAECVARYPQLASHTVLVGPTIDPDARTAGRQIWRWLANGRSESPAQLPITLRDYWDAGILRLIATFRYALADRIEDNLPAIGVPTLVVRGARDRVVSQPWAEQVTRLLPRGRLVVVPGAAHTVNFTHPRELSEVVREFVS
jgi:2-hydroxy-6-oxonona-2,4-dienedioate hydrolase